MMQRRGISSTQS